ncbi:MAG: sulfite exporter TauE/SafE family protein [Candidatus Bathyarchaeota archaeon]|nr:sulfite exporter TauE/SafE family protein [Candidatus Bathyarchaeota archaeon]
MIQLVQVVELFLLAFICGIIDLSLGMGYGFTVTPLMLMIGFTPQEAVPAVLFSSFVGGCCSSIWNHRMHNVDFNLKGKAFKIAAFTAGLGVLGAITGVYISFNIPQRILGLYIGVLVIAIGALVIYSKNLISEFSWNKMVGISLIGSLNKGLTGSGFGPVITTGAMLSGISEKESVSIQSLSESAVSLVGFAMYLVMGGYVDYQVVATMSAGVVLASPFAARIVNRIDGKTLRMLVGILAVIIGAYTIWKYI